MNNRNTKVVFSLFLINPFLSFLTSIGSLRHQIGKMERNLIFTSSIYNRLLLNILYVINQKYGLNL